MNRKKKLLTGSIVLLLISVLFAITTLYAWFTVSFDGNNQQVSVGSFAAEMKLNDEEISDVTLPPFAFKVSTVYKMDADDSKHTDSDLDSHFNEVVNAVAVSVKNTGTLPFILTTEFAVDQAASGYGIHHVFVPFDESYTDLLAAKDYSGVLDLFFKQGSGEQTVRVESQATVTATLLVWVCGVCKPATAPGSIVKIEDAVTITLTATQADGKLNPFGG